MDELASGTEMDENTSCAGPGSDTIKNEDEMGSTNPSMCTIACGLQFGVFPLKSQDSKSSNLTKELGNTSINFQGPAGEYQRILAQEKIGEIKHKVADYYYDSECKVIAIPNHFLTPKNPTVLGKEGKEKQDSQILDKYLEEYLHHELVNTARKSKWKAFIMNSFQSGDCIQQLVKKGKDTRGKDQTADFNEHEIRIKKLLDIEDIPKEKLNLCIEEHLKWKENKLEFKDAKSWLFRKECFIDNARVHKEHGGNKKNKIENPFLFKLPTSDLEKFYTYQYYNYSLQESKTEWDSLIIIPEHRAIINIEVKLGPKDQGDKLKLLENASDQTKQHFSFMQKLFRGMLSKDWMFVRAACVPYLEIVKGAEIPCINCQQFILQDVNDVTPWLNQIFDHKLFTSDNHDQTVYEDLVAELIYHISIKESSRFNQLISDPLTISKKVEKALTGKSDGISIENNVPVYMLNNEQLQAVKSTAKFLIIDGDYGTGKTYVLKERAKKCATDNHEDITFYIDLTAITNLNEEETYTNPTSVMDEMAKVEFESYPNIRVITMKSLFDIDELVSIKRNEIINSLNSFLRDNHCDHLFIDEMISGSCQFPGSVKTICMTMKVDDNFKKNMKERSEWIETMIKNHNALCLNLTKNLRNSQLIYKISEAFNSKTPPKLPDNNVIGSHIYYYHNIHRISPGLLAIAAVKKYFSFQPKEGVVVLSDLLYNSMFNLLHKHFSSTRPVVSDFKAFMNKPEGILVTNFWEFQGAQARNIIIIDDLVAEAYSNVFLRNMILRAMSFAIIVSYYIPTGNKFGAIVDENLHDFIYADRKAIDCHHYHNKEKHDISDITMAILDKYKLLDKDEGIVIVTYHRISKNIMKEANTKKFLSLTIKERKKQVREKIELENKKLYEELKRNISRKYDEISWSYHDEIEIKDLLNKPRHINYINLYHASEFFINEGMHFIVFADENIDYKHEFAAWGTLQYSDNETSINVNWSKSYRNRSEARSRDIILESQPKFAIVVHDGKIDTFSQSKEALNLIQDDNLHEHMTKITLEDRVKENNSLLSDLRADIKKLSETVSKEISAQSKFRTDTESSLKLLTERIQKLETDAVENVIILNQQKNKISELEDKVDYLEQTKEVEKGNNLPNQ